MKLDKVNLINFQSVMNIHFHLTILIYYQADKW